MKRLQKYIDREVKLEPLKDVPWLSSLGIEVRYVPETLEEFDEMEFGLGHAIGKPTIFTLVLVQGKLKRVSLGWIPEEGNEDELHAFSEPELAEVLEQKETSLTSFFDRITAA
ncbi:MAG: hypothetical protein C4520_05220 [Candidatus Abyssobacteria bacterium SURF_5]|uniref:Uncharacterized protein n=1 Tax=Abyssobacteria bacterium (strain SURF_5) TaxID=2093360 RepID=A0A3A4NTH4_ABYX5|nr:MAG: hypothetical protein C4520_05220 [Candidatus Abyssubacteria bacterium SURF_5]